jgi:hypothetical protein
MDIKILANLYLKKAQTGYLPNVPAQAVPENETTPLVQAKWAVSVNLQKLHGIIANIRLSSYAQKDQTLEQYAENVDEFLRWWYYRIIDVNETQAINDLRTRLNSLSAYVNQPEVFLRLKDSLLPDEDGYILRHPAIMMKEISPVYNNLKAAIKLLTQAKAAEKSK